MSTSVYLHFRTYFLVCELTIMVFNAVGLALQILSLLFFGFKDCALLTNGKMGDVCLETYADLERLDRDAAYKSNGSQ